MPEEFEGRDLSDAEFWGVDLSRAAFRDVNLTDTRMKNVWLVNVDIDGLVDRLVINGVDVTDFVNEHDRWYPLRGMLRPEDPAGMAAAWQALDETWRATIERARHLTPEQQHQSVGGEWSFVETLRHLTFGIDKWFTVPVLGDAFHPYGLPNIGSRDFPFGGLELDSNPSFDEALAVRDDRWRRVHDFIATIEQDDFDRSIDVLENGPHPLVECLYTVFEESFEHHRYAVRDLDLL
jgi:hypothetical protein